MLKPLHDRPTTTASSSARPPKARTVERSIGHFVERLDLAHPAERPALARVDAPPRESAGCAGVDVGNAAPANQNTPAARSTQRKVTKLENRRSAKVASILPLGRPANWAVISEIEALPPKAMARSAVR